MKKYVSLVLSGLLLSSCGLHQFKEGDPLLTLELAKAGAKAECYKNRKQVDTSGMSEIGKLALSQQQSYEKIIGAISGKQVDECSDGTNLNDVLIADSKNRNDTAKSVTSSITSFGTTAVITWGVTNVMGKAFDKAGDTAGGNINKDHSSSTDTIGGDRVGRDKIGGDQAGGDQTGDKNVTNDPPVEPVIE
jgi:hypothetical protein